jgi:hypothetical protein
VNRIGSGSSSHLRWYMWVAGQAWINAHVSRGSSDGILAPPRLKGRPRASAAAVVLRVTGDSGGC